MDNSLKNRKPKYQHLVLTRAKEVANFIIATYSWCSTTMMSHSVENQVTTSIFENRGRCSVKLLAMQARQKSVRIVVLS